LQHSGRRGMAAGECYTHPQGLRYSSLCGWWWELDQVNCNVEWSCD